MLLLTAYILCIFCDETNAADHSFQKVTLTQDIRDKVVTLGEEHIIALLVEGDLVAIEAKNHRTASQGSIVLGFNGDQIAVDKEYYNILFPRRDLSRISWLSVTFWKE